MIGNLNLENNNVYSTDEVRIGTWIDGKPIYRKVVDFTVSGSDVTTWTNIQEISNIDVLINIYGIYNTSTRTILFPRYESANFYQVYRLFMSYIQYMSKGYENLNIKLIIEYTKTTD